MQNHGPPRLTARFSEALSYATELHQHQRRKGGDIPYIGHLLSVASLVIEADGSETQVIAALLHDAAEDQGGAETLADIESRFGTSVAAIVGECSDTLETTKPAWRIRKQRYVAHLAEVSADTILVSLADKLDNSRAILRDLRNQGPSLWNRFSQSDPEDHLWYCRNLAAQFRIRTDNWMVDELARAIAQIEAEVVSTPAGPTD